MQETLMRALDILVSSLAIVVGLPLLLIIFILGMFDSGSPLFLQARVGRGEKLFTLVKFRTMAKDTRSVGTHLIDSTVITKLGSILRKTKLDELPQLCNVLLGQMSLVGPRPCLPNQTELIEERNKRGIFKVRPGITGLAQVHAVDMSTPRKLARYDQLMIERMCITLYIKLIFTTLLGQGRGDRVSV
jgi:lipopolysaccharide/colanic/teichoic acid biosynthesis glycosyltransferase